MDSQQGLVEIQPAFSEGRVGRVYVDCKILFRFFPNSSGIFRAWETSGGGDGVAICSRSGGKVENER